MSPPPGAGDPYGQHNPYDNQPIQPAYPPPSTTPNPYDTHYNSQAPYDPFLSSQSLPQQPYQDQHAHFAAPATDPFAGGHHSPPPQDAYLAPLQTFSPPPQNRPSPHATTSYQLEDEGVAPHDELGDIPLLRRDSAASGPGTSMPMPGAYAASDAQSEANIHYGRIPQRVPRRYKTMKRVE
jgi:chitin synthase